MTLKLCGVIDWSWWYVTMPFWGGVALLLAIGLAVGVIFVVGLLIVVVVDLLNRRNRRRQNRRKGASK